MGPELRGRRDQRAAAQRREAGADPIADQQDDVDDHADDREEQADDHAAFARAIRRRERGSPYVRSRRWGTR